MNCPLCSRRVSPGDICARGHPRLCFGRQSFIYADWHHNLIIDPDHPLVEKKRRRYPERQILSTFHDLEPPLDHLGSENSEDALTWNVFRTIEKSGQADLLVRDWLGADGSWHFYYWTWDPVTLEQFEPYTEAIRAIEPHNRGQASQIDLLLADQHAGECILIEAKVGNEALSAPRWPSNPNCRVDYLSSYVRAQGTPPPFTFELTLDVFYKERYYQLVRHVLFADWIGRAYGWETLFVTLLAPNLGRGGKNVSRCLSFRDRLTPGWKDRYRVTTWAHVYHAVPESAKTMPLRDNWTLQSYLERKTYRCRPARLTELTRLAFIQEG